MIKKLGIIKIVGKICGHFTLSVGKSALIYLVTLLGIGVLCPLDQNCHVLMSLNLCPQVVGHNNNFGPPGAPGSCGTITVLLTVESPVKLNSF